MFQILTFQKFAQAWDFIVDDIEYFVQKIICGKDEVIFEFVIACYYGWENI